MAKIKGWYVQRQVEDIFLQRLKQDSEARQTFHTWIPVCSLYSLLVGHCDSLCARGTPVWHILVGFHLFWWWIIMVWTTNCPNFPCTRSVVKHWTILSTSPYWLLGSSTSLIALKSFSDIDVWWTVVSSPFFLSVFTTPVNTFFVVKEASGQSRTER